jgi:AAA15 family ATPase/GTPase
VQNSLRSGMIVRKLSVRKFRGFRDVSFDLGKKITVISGQNGTQKTTLLGIISQPFSISMEEHPMHGEKPLSGGNYKSSFSEKFKLSDQYDIAGSHEWTMEFDSINEEPMTLRSYRRKGKDIKKNQLRFWRKGDRSKGAGYVGLPVIFLSLQRLFPLGEDDNLEAKQNTNLTDEEFSLFQEMHNKVLCIPDLEITKADYLSSDQKVTLGVNTNFYDWKMNSAGQDNLGKLLLALFSFKRLKERYDKEYCGGMLVVDEIDSTLYPASQIELIKLLRKCSSKWDIQIVFTTHSLTLIQAAYEMKNARKNNEDVKIVYLEKIDQEVQVLDTLSYQGIKNRLNITLNVEKQINKIPVFVEDKEAEMLAKGILKRKASILKFAGCSLGHGNLIDLSRKKIQGFKYPDSLIILDGDVGKGKRAQRELTSLKNILLLPGKESPERELACFLHKERESSDVWSNIYSDGDSQYSKQLAFRDYSYNDIMKDRKKAKLWFNDQKKYWGRGGVKLINMWIKRNQAQVETFIKEYEILVNKIKTELAVRF